MKSQRQGLFQVVTDLPLLVLTLIFLVGSMRLDSGELHQMGPGWFPLLLSATLLILVIGQWLRCPGGLPEPDRGGAISIGSAVAAFAVFIVFGHSGWVAMGAIAALALMFVVINRRKASEKWVVLLVIGLVLLLVHRFFPQ